MSVQLSEISFKQHLLQNGAVSLEDLEIAAKHAAQTGKSVNEVLLEFGLLSPKKYAEQLSSFFNIPYIDISDMELEVIPDLPVSVKFLRQYKILPLGKMIVVKKS